MIKKLIDALNGWWLARETFSQESNVHNPSFYYHQKSLAAYLKDEEQLKQSLEQYLTNKVKELIILDRGEAREDKYGFIIVALRKQDEVFLKSIGWTWNDRTNRWLRPE
jgi:hypothetical protein